MANPAATLLRTHLRVSLTRASSSAWAVRGNEEGQHGVFFIYRRFVLPGALFSMIAAPILSKSPAAVPQAVIIPPVELPMVVRHSG
jgi:hypothetical protein